MPDIGASLWAGAPLPFVFASPAGSQFKHSSRDFSGCTSYGWHPFAQASIDPEPRLNYTGSLGTTTGFIQEGFVSDSTTADAGDGIVGNGKDKPSYGLAILMSQSPSNTLATTREQAAVSSILLSSQIPPIVCLRILAIFCVHDYETSDFTRLRSPLPAPGTLICIHLYTSSPRMFVSLNPWDYPAPTMSSAITIATAPPLTSRR